MISKTKYFPAYQMTKGEALKIQVLMGFKPKTKYFIASKISDKKVYEILKDRANGVSKEKA